jgi:hypothetical protein
MWVRERTRRKAGTRACSARPFALHAGSIEPATLGSEKKYEKIPLKNGCSDFTATFVHSLLPTTSSYEANYLDQMQVLIGLRIRFPLE